MKWVCPSCVCLGRSAEISTQMKDQWEDNEYRDHQTEIKHQPQYIEIQSEKSKLRWLDEDYRSQIETGINIDNYLLICKERFADQFTYDLSSFGNWKDKITITCSTCNFTFQRNPQLHLNHGSCQSCKLPSDIKLLLPSSEQVIINDRAAIAPLELDIYWPDHHFAIEYHGLYWHSYNSLETTSEKARHQKKAIACQNMGIRLIQIFDYEWQIKKQLIKSMISHMLGKSVKMMARNLTIRDMKNVEIQKFFNENHLQGHRNASITLALIYNDEIIMAASFSKHDDGYEIIRMATKMGYSVSGGAGKLIHHFKKNILKRPLYTFADLRHSTGNVYKQLGFKLLGISKPGYFYYKKTHRNILSRQQCQKHKLSNLLKEGYDKLLSEPENMFKNGYRRVWDAGHIKLVLQ